MKHQFFRWRQMLGALSLGFVLFSGTAAAAPILSENSHGHDVTVLQQELLRTGYLSDAPDGVFGNNTKRAVLAFQRDHKLKTTGIVDRATWDALKKAKKNEARTKQGTASKELSGAAKDAKEKPKDSSAKASATTKANKVPESQLFLSRGQVSTLLSTAKKYIGVPYQFGGTTPKAFDCSGYLQYVFAQHGLSIPRTADEQFKLGQKTVSANQLEPGDLVFFSTYASGASHCGIYIGNGQFIHASSSKGVRIDDLSNSYWKPRYYGGKHIIK